MIKGKIVALLPLLSLFGGNFAIANVPAPETASPATVETALSEPEVMTPEALCALPVQLELLDSDVATQNPEALVTERTLSQEELMIPSLWWAKRQFDRYKGKLVRNWLAFPQEQRIDLVVNRQLWSLMNYLERYRLLNEFGTVARNYGYQLRIVNQYQDCLATYQRQGNRSLEVPQWEIHLFGSGENSFQL